MRMEVCTREIHALLHLHQSLDMFLLHLKASERFTTENEPGNEQHIVLLPEVGSTQ
eukprot:m.89179 g.89179  ORF g.89179 m.89179 type:complete len:56 (+) comp14568_c2_seq1:2458-2625(+)